MEDIETCLEFNNIVKFQNQLHRLTHISHFT